MLRMQATYGNQAVVRHLDAKRANKGDEKGESPEDVEAAMRKLHQISASRIAGRAVAQAPRQKAARPPAQKAKAAPRPSRKTAARPHARVAARRPGPARAGLRPRPGGAGGAGRLGLPALPTLPELADYRRRVIQTWHNLHGAAETAKAAVRVDAALTAASTMREMLAQADEVDKGYGDAISSVETAAKTAAEHVERERSDKAQAAASCERDERARLDQVFVDQAKAVRKAADDKAKLITDLADSEGRRAQEECHKKAQHAWAMLLRKLPKYKNYDRKDRIERVLQEMTSDAVDSLGKAGVEIDKSVHDDAADASKMFREQASDAADGITDGKDDAHQRLDENAHGVVDSINQIGHGALPQIAELRKRTIDELSQERQAIVPSMRVSAAAVLPALTTSAEHVCTVIDSATNDRVQKLNHAAARAGRQLAIFRGKILAESIAEADRELAGSVTEHRHNLATLKTGAEKTFAEAAGKMSTQLRTSSGSISATAAAAATSTVLGLTKLEVDAVASIGKVQKTAADKIKGGVDKVEAELKKKVAESADKWQREIDASTPKMKKKVDDALESQEKTVTDLDSALDDKAEEIENESWLSRALNSIAGFLVGILEAAWDFLCGILKILGWVLLGLVAIVLLVVLLVLLAPELAAALVIGLITVAAWAAAALAAYGTYLAIGLGIYLVAKSAWALYKSEQVKGLSDFERFRARGKFVGDAGTAVFGGKIIGWLGKVGGRFSRWVGIFGNEARATKAMLAFGGDEARLEQALSSVGGDGARLERLVTAVGDGTKFEQLLGAVGNDASRLERLLGASGGDAGQLKRLLEAAGQDAGRVENALAQAEGDVAKAEQSLKAPPEPAAPPTESAPLKAEPTEPAKADPTEPAKAEPTEPTKPEEPVKKEEVEAKKEEPAGPSGKQWDDPTLTRDEFIKDYRARYPKTTLKDADLADAYAEGYRLNPETGRLKIPRVEPPPGFERGDLPKPGSPEYQQWKNWKPGDPDSIPCFPAGTLVHTPDGARPIESLGVGARVWAWDENRRCVQSSSITALHRNYAEELVLIETGRGSMCATCNHPYWVANRNAWMPAAKLESGMTLRLLDGSTTEISRTVRLAAQEPTFNLTVAALHTYWVSENGFLVHNDDKISAYADATTYDTTIYSVIDKGTGEVVYVGKTDQELADRLYQHATTEESALYLKDPHARANYKDIYEIRARIKGRWTTYESNVWEQHQMDVERARGSKLLNRQEGIDWAKGKKYAEMHNPCR